MDADDRLARVEARLDRIEEALGLRAGALPASTEARREPIVAQAATAPKLPVASPVVPKTRPQPAAERRTTAPRAARVGPKRDLERLFGVAVLGRVGIACLLLAAAYFAKLAWHDVGPEARVAGIWGLAVVLVGVGFWLRPRVAPKYVALLWGGGTAAAYMAGVVAKLLYDLVGTVPALAMLVAACALGQGLARIQRSSVLAHVALAGAIAAPVIVGSPVDSRTALLVYLLTVHAWAVVAERLYAWKGARWVALAGVSLVGLLWLLEHGQYDLSTCLHVHAYFAGLAWPEIARGFTRRGLTPAAGTAVCAAAVPVEVAWIFASWNVDGMPAFSFMAGLAWLAIGAGWRVAARKPVAPGIREAVRLGECLLAIGALTIMRVWVPEPDDHALRAAAALVLLAGLGMVCLAARSWFGAGSGPAALAMLLTYGLLDAASPGWCILGLAVPAALVLSGQPGIFRQLGFFGGIGACFVGFGDGQAPHWMGVAFGVASASFAAGSVLAFRRKDRALLQAVDFAPLLLGILWIVHAFGGAFADVAPPLLNGGTTTAVLLLGALAVRLARREPDRIGRHVDLRRIPVVAIVALAGLAGWREVAGATASLSAVDMRLGLRALYVAVFAAGCFIVGRRRGGIILEVAGVIALALAASLAIDNLQHVRLMPWAAAGAGAAASAAAAAGWGLGGASIVSRVGGFAVVSVLAVIWSLAGWLRWLPAESAFLNTRFGLGVGLIAAMALCRRGLSGLGLKPLLPWVEALAAMAAFAVGWVDLRAAIAGVRSPHLASALGSVWATIAAAAVLAAGFKTRASHLRWMGLLGFAAVVVKVGLSDLASVDTPFRILVTACLGAVLLCAAWGYSRRKSSPESSKQS